MSPTHSKSCKTRQRLASGCIAFLVSLSACADDAATVPGGPSLAALHSHLQFNLLVSPRRADESDPFLQQARRVIAGLQVAGTGMFPDAAQRVGAFDVFVADSDELSAASSATGQIALNAAFIALKPTDDWLAYVLAREMAHVIAGHHANNSTASIATSVVMNLLLPGRACCAARCLSSVRNWLRSPGASGKLRWPTRWPFGCSKPPATRRSRSR